MQLKSILLPIDGSFESLQATRVACSIAKTANAKVLAQTVLDTNALWDLIGHDTAGLIGSGPYMSAYETMTTAFRSVCETLLVAFDALVDHAVEASTVLDEGNLVRAVLNRASDHDLLVVGHRRNRRQDDDPEHYFIRHSLCERLGSSCPVPLLIVQGQCPQWRNARLLINQDSYSPALIEQFCAVTSTLALIPEIFIVDNDDKQAKKMAGKLKESLPAASKAKIVINDPNECDDAWACAQDVHADTLLVISTNELDNVRLTCARTPLQSFISELEPAGTLILPPAKVSRSAPAVRSAVLPSQA